MVSRAGPGVCWRWPIIVLPSPFQATLDRFRNVVPEREPITLTKVAACAHTVPALARIEGDVKACHSCSHVLAEVSAAGIESALK